MDDRVAGHTMRSWGEDPDAYWALMAPAADGWVAET